MPPVAPKLALAPLGAATASSVTPPIADVPEIAPLPPVVPRMASLSPDAATPRVALAPPVTPKLASAPFGAIHFRAACRRPLPRLSCCCPTPSRRTPCRCRRGVPLTSHRKPPGAAGRSGSDHGRRAEPPPVERDHDIARPAPGETTVQPTVASAPSAAAPAQLDNRSIFQRIFGAFSQPSAPSGGTAVYDIAAHTVYMPNGERLEAHSGLGSNLDDPRSISEKNLGRDPAPDLCSPAPRAAVPRGRGPAAQPSR